MTENDANESTRSRRLKEGISNIDKDSFFVITDSYEVKGGA